MMFKIYHNPRCKISREVLSVLQSHSQNIEIVEYLKNKLSIDEIKSLCLILNLPPEEIIRKNEDYYKKNLKGKSFSEYEWFRIIHENPILIERPIVISGYKAIICRPPEKVQDLLIKK